MAASATLDAKILESRLVTRDSTVGGSSVFRIAKSLKEYHDALIQSPANEQAVKLAKDVYTRDVLTYQLEVSKVDKMLQLCDVENDNYQKQEAEMQDEIVVAVTKIADSEQDLGVQKRIRSFTEKCESKAALVNELPVQSVLKRQIEDCDITLEKLAATYEVVEARLQKRVRQYEGLMDAIQTLSSPLVESSGTGIAGGAGAGLTEGGDAEEDEEEDDERDVNGEEGSSRNKGSTSEPAGNTGGDGDDANEEDDAAMTEDDSGAGEEPAEATESAESMEED